eukprot:2825833-Rhodomonas_salina.2
MAGIAGYFASRNASNERIRQMQLENEKALIRLRIMQDFKKMGEGEIDGNLAGSHEKGKNVAVVAGGERSEGRPSLRGVATSNSVAAGSDGGGRGGGIRSIFGINPTHKTSFSKRSGEGMRREAAGGGYPGGSSESYPGGIAYNRGEEIDSRPGTRTTQTSANASDILAYTSCDACHTRARLLQEFPEPDLSDGPILPLYRYAKVLGGHLDNLKEKVILPVERTMEENKLHVIFMQYLNDALHLLIEKRLKKQGVDESTFEANELLQMESLLEFQNYLNSKRSESGKLFVHSLYDEDRALVVSLLREQAKYDLNGFNGVLTWKYKDDEKDFMRGKLAHLSECLRLKVDPNTESKDMKKKFEYSQAYRTVSSMNIPNLEKNTIVHCFNIWYDVVKCTTKSIPIPDTTVIRIDSIVPSSHPAKERVPVTATTTASTEVTEMRDNGKENVEAKTTVKVSVNPIAVPVMREVL